jgi:hypothetical protein
MPLKPSDRVLWQYLGQQGDTGVIRKQIATGGSRYRVRVRWNKTGSTGSHDDRVLKKISGERS